MVRSPVVGMISTLMWSFNSASQAYLQVLTANLQSMQHRPGLALPHDRVVQCRGRLASASGERPCLLAAAVLSTAGRQDLPRSSLLLSGCHRARSRQPEQVGVQKPCPSGPGSLACCWSHKQSTGVARSSLALPGVQGIRTAGSTVRVRVDCIAGSSRRLSAVRCRDAAGSAA